MPDPEKPWTTDALLRTFKTYILTNLAHPLHATHSIEALGSFIRAQRLLLEQTQEDIAKLKKLKSYTLAKPNAMSEDLIHQVAHPFFDFALGAYLLASWMKLGK